MNNHIHVHIKSQCPSSFTCQSIDSFVVHSLYFLSFPLLFFLFLFAVPEINNKHTRLYFLENICGKWMRDLKQLLKKNEVPVNWDIEILQKKKKSFMLQTKRVGKIFKELSLIYSRFSINSSREYHDLYCFDLYVLLTSNSYFKLFLFLNAPLSVELRMLYLCREVRSPPNKKRCPRLDTKPRLMVRHLSAWKYVLFYCHYSQVHFDMERSHIQVKYICWKIWILQRIHIN